jgi:hypothetical protein
MRLQNLGCQSGSDKRERDHIEKVKEAQDLIEKWKEKKRREDWKVWIARDPKFTKRWLTRAANRNDLRPPCL